MAWPIIKLVSAGISAGTNIISGWQDRKTAVVKSKIQIKEAQTGAEIKRIAERGSADISWENTSLEQSGWKDEFWTIVIAVPTIMCFVPGLVQYALDGFNALKQTPLWYQSLVATAVGSAFGVKKFISFMKTKKGT